MLPYSPACTRPPDDSTFSASKRDILGFLAMKCDPEFFLGLLGVSMLEYLILLALSWLNMECAVGFLTPLEPSVENGRALLEGGDFFCPISLDRMSDIEKGEECP